MELALRIIRPDLKYLVNSDFVTNKFRIHTNPKNLITKHDRPDSGGTVHRVIFNSLGCRQHREFTIKKPAHTTRIGFFGDSFTENLRIPVHYSFTEPLDFLLNQTGNSYQVLNFGTDGYGTDQIYLQYMDEGIKLNLDTVIYMYYPNDLRDILADKLVDLDKNGHIYYLPAKPPGLLKRTIRKFYLTYFLLEISSTYDILMPYLLYDAGKISEARNESENRKPLKDLPGLHARGIEDPRLDRALRIFSALLIEMKQKVNSNSARFYVVLVPSKNFREYNQHYLKMRKLIEGLGIDVLDLSEAFEQQKQNSAVFYFKKDSHWNEEGNKIAVVYLFKFLTGKLGIDYDGDYFIKSNLYRYYYSFPPPSITITWLKNTVLTDSLKEAINSRYLALDRVYHSRPVK